MKDNPQEEKILEMFKPKVLNVMELRKEVKEFFLSRYYSAPITFIIAIIIFIFAIIFLILSIRGFLI